MTSRLVSVTQLDYNKPDFVPKKPVPTAVSTLMCLTIILFTLKPLLSYDLDIHVMRVVYLIKILQHDQAKTVVRTCMT